MGGFNPAFTRAAKRQIGMEIITCKWERENFHYRKESWQNKAGGESCCDKVEQSLIYEKMRSQAIVFQTIWYDSQN